MCAATTAAMHKGENVVLSALADDLGSISVILEWAAGPEQPLDADVSVLLLGDDGRVRSNDDLIFYNQPSGAGGAVRLRGKTRTPDDESVVYTDIIDLDMDDVPDSVERVLLAASLDGDLGSLADLKYLGLRLLRGSDAVELLRFDVAATQQETAFVLGEVYRRAGQWKFRAVGQGYDSGLGTLVTEYGVEVDADDTDPAAGLDDDATIGETTDTGAGRPGPVDANANSAGGTTPAGSVVAGDLTGGTDPRDPRGTTAETSGPTVASPAARSGAGAADGVGAASGTAGSGRQATGVRRAHAVTTRKRVAARRLSASRGRRALAVETESQWQAARLFPVAGIGGAAEQERRATSALLATLGAVREFGRSLTTRFGAPAGQIETFLEVPFNLEERPYIPDGLIRVTRGQRTWTALVEVKTGSGELTAEQVGAYLDIARDQQFDAVITISNLITTADERHPVGIDGRRTKKVAVHHLSWADIRFRCQLLLENDMVADRTQGYILAEFLRYLEHGRSGAQTFEDMGPTWVTVRDSVAAGTLRPSDRGLSAVAGRFDQLAHFLCLHLGGLLGVEAMPQSGRRSDALSRRQALADELCRTGTLSATLRIPGAVAPLVVSADLRAGRVVCSVTVEAPRQGRPMTRVRWILRQLGEANGNLRLESFETGARDAVRAELLALVRQKPEIMISDSARDIRAFRGSLSAPLGTKRGVGKGTFVTSVVETLERFYEEVVQNLREWQGSADGAAVDDGTGAA
ncbi:TerD family protein [Frankia sp. AgPm24]|uniref:TerD family protein n=1 Tax=Frankia sp. AgPm24 TaxID=631128 RepID=UPI00200BDD63|nr:TerD family protein [Frankia sp. AgPm24]MCK9924759.1 TerD family protein [Frankia sp. AgPm24]